MTENQKARLEQIIQEGYNFDFGGYISKGFNLFQKDIGNFVLFAFVFLIGMMFIVVPVIGWFGVPLVLYPVFLVGFYNAAHKLHRGENLQFGDFFKGFDKVGQLALAMLVVGLITLVAQMPYHLANSDLYLWYFDFLQDPESGMYNLPPTKFWTYILLLPSIAVGALYSLTLPFIWFYDLQFWDAMESSRKVVSKKFWLFLAFVFVVGLIGGVGVYLCCIGFLATYPASICMTYAAFQDITKLNEHPDENAGIEQHLVE